MYVYIYMHNILHNIFSKRTLARATTEECITCVVTFFKYHVQTRTKSPGTRVAMYVCMYFFFEKNPLTYTYICVYVTCGSCDKRVSSRVCIKFSSVVWSLYTQMPCSWRKYDTGSFETILLLGDAIL